MSADSAERHRAFREELGVSVPLIPDTGKEVATLYGARQLFGRLPVRVTYVIDTAGIIRAVSTHRLQFERHGSDALAVVQELAATPEAEEQLP